MVVDYAEIPAFQERIRIDTNGDGDVSDDEAFAARARECNTLTPSLHLTVGSAPLALTLRGAGLEFPAGAGGVPTMRVVCEFVAPTSAPLTDGRIVTYADASYAERIGWREIVVLGDGVAIAGAGGAKAPAVDDLSARLSAYPKDLLTQPLDIRSAAFTVAPGGQPLAPFVAADATPLEGSSLQGSAGPNGPVTTASPGAAAAAAVPGGVGDIPDLFRVANLTPLLALASVILAMALGAGHALTPGHGKTLMAAYLVGTRGTIRHAAGLGLAVTVSHTLGILGLALLVTGAESLLPPDVVVRTIPVVAALAFVAIGGSMLFAEVRKRYRGARLVAAAHAADHEDDLSHEPGHSHESEGPHVHDHAHEHAPASEHDHAPELATAVGEHSHGGIPHSHLPAGDRTLSWKSLFALGLAGGIIPSTNALIILLGTIVAGRAAFGVVLVIAFGLGMALVLGGVGALMVVARERMERLPLGSGLGRVARQAPLIASVAVLGIGLWLTAQALGGTTVL